MFERHYTLAQLSVNADVGSSERIASYMEGQFGRPELSADLGYRFSQELFSHYLSESKGLYFEIAPFKTLTARFQNNTFPYYNTQRNIAQQSPTSFGEMEGVI